MAGALLVGTLLLGGVLIVGRGDSPATGPVAGGALGPAPNVDLASMTPREAADNLFFRVMRAVERSDYAEANDFLPMAIRAYEIAGPLDEDGLFHLSLLQRAGRDYEGALATALEGLRENPEHLLNLSAAAEASRELGDLEAARDHYTRMLDAWDREMAEMRQEYDEHHPLLPLIREDAESFLAEGGP